MTNTERKFIISGREIGKDTPLFSLTRWFPFMNKYFGSTNIEAVYSSVKERSPLYGGRQNSDHQSFTFENIDMLNSKGIGFILTLSNHYFTEEAYKQTIPIFERISKSINTVTIVNDELAKRLKVDFPLLKRKASVIKLLLTKDKIEKAFDLYDCVTLSPWLNDDPELLQSLDNKENLILFANAACLYKCRNPKCYIGVSYRFINNLPFGNGIKLPDHINSGCSNKDNPENKSNFVVFDLNKDHFNGYSLFKLIPINKSKLPEVI